MNEELNISEDWIKANNLSLNGGSKKLYIIKKHGIKWKKLLINGEEIVLVSKTKLVGIIGDEHLEWKEHIDLCKRKISNSNCSKKPEKYSLLL